MFYSRSLDYLIQSLLGLIQPRELMLCSDSLTLAKFECFITFYICPEDKRIVPRIISTAWGLTHDALQLYDARLMGNVSFMLT